MITTPLCALLGIERPIFNASMAGTATGDFAHLWLYIVGPVVGSIIAVGLAWLLRGPGGDPKDKEAVQGSMNRAAEAETF